MQVSSVQVRFWPWLSSQLTYKTVQPRPDSGLGYQVQVFHNFWPWPSGSRPSELLSCPLLAGRRLGDADLRRLPAIPFPTARTLHWSRRVRPSPKRDFFIDTLLIRINCSRPGDADLRRLPAMPFLGSSIRNCFAVMRSGSEQGLY